MNRVFKIFLFLVMSLQSVIGSAEATDPVVVGFVSTFSESVVRLYVRGRFIKVPRSSIADKKLRIGLQVTAKPSMAELKKLNAAK